MINMDFSIANVATLFFSSIAALLSYLAYRISRERIRLELFEKRWEIYLPILSFCSSLSGYAGFPDFEKHKEKVIKILESADKSFRSEGWHKSQALFGKDIHDLLSELNTMYAFFISHKEKNGDQKLIEQEFEYLKRLFEIVNNLPKYFKPYMYFGDYNADNL